VLGLRYYRCVTCETVYADLTEPPACDDCDVRSFEEMTDRLGAYLVGVPLSPTTPRV
jgi:hypothetical protein